MTKKTSPMTSKQKTDKRKAQLQAAAIRDGFKDLPNSKAWSQALTAWKNGEYKLTKVQS